MSKIRVLFFSVLREKLGCASVVLDLEHAIDAGELLDSLADTYPAMRAYRGSLRVAVNQAYVDLEHPVRGGDEVALITPVSGG